MVRGDEVLGVAEESSATLLTTSLSLDNVLEASVEEKIGDGIRDHSQLPACHGSRRPLRQLQTQTIGVDKRLTLRLLRHLKERVRERPWLLGEEHRCDS